MNKIKSLVIKLAGKDDVDSLTKLHMKSFSKDDHLGTLLGPEFVRDSYYWHVTNEDSYVIVALIEREMVGFLGMCDGPFTSKMLKGCIFSFIKSLIFSPKLIFDKRLWTRLSRDKPKFKWVSDFCSAKGVAQMTIGAVDEKARGFCVFPSLIRRCEDISKDRKIMAIRAGVYKGNIPCQRAFIKSGWAEINELGSDETVYFVKVFDPELIIKFPQLKSVSHMNK